MDEKGYAFTPLAFLLFIPVIVIALSYGSIVNELNDLSALAIGGDVTYNTATNIYSAMEKGAADAGRNGAYNATRNVIDNNAFMTDSKSYITNNVMNNMNDYVITACQRLELETGRQIYINNISITNSTYQVFKSGDVSITQEDPFGFYVNIKGGIPIRVEQKDQVFEGYTPEMKAYVSIEGIEDPYIWINSKERISTVIYKYPHFIKDPLGNDYQFHYSTDSDGKRLHYLWECMNGTGNPSEIYPRPYYFIDPNGLSFFDRLENKTSASSTSASNSRMSTFVLGDPLYEDHGSNAAISRLDHEYFAGVGGTQIYLGTGSNQIEMREPDINGTPNGDIFYLSSAYKTFFDLTAAHY
ncbi:hypothetical protein [Methanobacterium aggregans]|uniref:hypothetical protein n=1 Tax=Methanobacterium aggregans TaxID=1615586 RepID=UPI001AE3178E|nr:hypothetical protein [Methanobacterium aggregans]MBP2045224.1 hypothetical protein [Methanobacterium aggregans]